MFRIGGSKKLKTLRSLLRRVSDPQGKCLDMIRSLTPQQAARNALAVGFTVTLRLKISFFFIWFLILLIAFTPAADARSPIRLTILHVNDTHGHLLPAIETGIDPDEPVGGAAWMASMIAKERGKNPRGTFLFSGGDMFQGTALSNVFRGAPVIEVMNALKFDAMAIGNHEFDWGRDILDHLRASARFPFISANIVDPRGNPLSGVKPYILLERKGVKAAVIGITTTETAYTTKPDNVKDLTFLEPKDVLPGIIRTVKAKGAKLIIVLSHAGLDADRKMARDVHGIHVIIGGHSHTAVVNPVIVGRTIIVQAGCYGYYLGVLNLTFDAEKDRVIFYTKKKELNTVHSKPEDLFDPEIARLVETYHQRIRDRFAAVVGETDVDLIRNSRGESNVGNLICDALRETARAEIAFHNSGGIRANIPKGTITLEQTYALLPFDNLLISMDLTGKQILRILEKNAAGEHGILQVSGLRVVYDLAKSVGGRVIKVEVTGQTLAPDRNYRIVTNDFLAAGGDTFSVFKDGKNIRYGDALRDVFVGYLKKRSPVQPEVEGRMVGLD